MLTPREENFRAKREAEFKRFNGSWKGKGQKIRVRPQLMYRNTLETKKKKPRICQGNLFSSYGINIFLRLYSQATSVSCVPE